MLLLGGGQRIIVVDHRTCFGSLALMSSYRLVQILRSAIVQEVYLGISVDVAAHA